MPTIINDKVGKIFQKLDKMFENYFFQKLHLIFS